MPSDYAPEYTPELSKSYLDSITGDIDDLGRIDEGRASAEAASRGLLDQGAFMGSATGRVRQGVAREKSRNIGAFNLNVAEARRGERLGEKSRGWNVEDRNFGAAEAEKSRAFQKQMAEIGYQFEKDQADKAGKFSWGGFASGVAGKAIGAGVGGYAGGLGAAAGACWVAREVYGKDNPQWLVFRLWLFNIAPTWFRDLYLRHGERFAQFISDKPTVKAIIRRWMDSRIRTGVAHVIS